MAKLFGFEFQWNHKSSAPIATNNKPTGTALSPVPPMDTDGALNIQYAGAGGYWGYTIDLDGTVVDDFQLINRYREMQIVAEVDEAIDQIVNEVVIQDAGRMPVTLDLDYVDENVLDEKTKIRLQAEFDNLLKQLKFHKDAYSLVRQWYIDGRIYFHLIVDEERPENGIQELRMIDPRTIRKIREVTRKRHEDTQMDIVEVQREYFVFNPMGFVSPTNISGQTGASASMLQYNGIKITCDSIAFTPSGLYDANKRTVLSWLHKAIKPLNLLRMIEDSCVIYRVARAPERRVFYIDVGNLPKQKAEQYLYDIMQKYRNKMVYDVATGEVRDDRKFMSIMEDFWLPRRDCLVLDTQISLLDGRNVTLDTLISEYESGKTNWAYSVSPQGKIVPGKITWAGITRKNAELVKVTLDNGESVTCTPDHKFVLRDGTKCPAKDLQPQTSLMPLYTRQHHVTHNVNGEYQQVFDQERQKWIFTHRMVAENTNPPKQINEVVHHRDCARANNNPDNLVYMDKQEHIAYHSKMGTNSWVNGNREEHRRNLSIAGKAYFETPEGMETRKRIGERNKTDQRIIDGFQKGRDAIKIQRDADKSFMSHEDYIAKWSPGLTAMRVHAKHVQDVTHGTEFFNDIAGAIDTLFHRKLTLSEIAKHLTKITGRVVGAGSIRKSIKLHTGSTANEYIAQKYGTEYKWRGRYVPAPHNHKVVSVEFLTERQDTGTISIDENHEQHDYHNFALTAGVFVMNSSKGTEITTLPAGQNLSQMEDVDYFRRKLYRALGLPPSRVDQGTGFNIGRASEISRDELRFMKFVHRLQMQFSTLFDQLMERQLRLKNVLTEQEWWRVKDNIRYKWQQDSYFEELKGQEMWTSRLNLITQMDPYLNKYFSEKWVRRQILQFTDDEWASIHEDFADAVTLDENGEPILPEDDVDNLSGSKFDSAADHILNSGAEHALTPESAVDAPEEGTYEVVSTDAERTEQPSIPVKKPAESKKSPFGKKSK